MRVLPELLLGVEAGGSVFTYSQSGSGNSTSTPGGTQWSLGAFGSTQISEYLSARLDGGYMTYTPDSTGASLMTSDTSGFYFSLSVTHRVNKFFSYTLSAGRSTDASFYGQAQTYYYVRLNPAWNLFQKYTFSTPLWWQQGSQVYSTRGGGNNGDYQQIGAGLAVSRALTKKLSSSLSYQFVEETSDQSSLKSSLNYTVNIVDLSFTYQF